MSKEKGGSKPKGEKGEGQGKNGSQGLSRMIGRQEMIRMRLEEMRQGENGEKDAKLLKEIEDLMKKNEEDIAKGNFDAEFFNRQREIESKLLESEKAELEREKDEERESNTSLDEYEIRRINELNRYLKNKGIDTEKFKIERIDLSPFYLEKSFERSQ